MIKERSNSADKQDNQKREAPKENNYNPFPRLEEGGLGTSNLKPAAPPKESDEQNE